MLHVKGPTPTFKFSCEIFTRTWAPTLTKANTPAEQQTSLIEVSELAKAMRLPPNVRLYLKVEGENPTGTHKDRAAVAVVQEALTLGCSEIWVPTCGNFGEAVARAAQGQNLKVRVFVPEDRKLDNEDKIRDYGAELVRVPGSYEQVVESVTLEAMRANTEEEIESKAEEVGEENRRAREIKVYDKKNIEIVFDFDDCYQALLKQLPDMGVDAMMDCNNNLQVKVKEVV